ncbi:hypothetical protein [Nocardia wallacei]|uniref:hypothetical protein n=1 Tax=Nocardia wallacei TaxID=480035 RepID=UPI002458B75E|nr:hypothetical protein [Nocardia wallacei]
MSDRVELTGRDGSRWELVYGGSDPMPANDGIYQGRESAGPEVWPDWPDWMFTIPGSWELPDNGDDDE